MVVDHMFVPTMVVRIQIFWAASNTKHSRVPNRVATGAATIRPGACCGRDVSTSAARLYDNSAFSIQLNISQVRPYESIMYMHRAIIS